MFDVRYSFTDSSDRVIVQPAAERSAEASDNSNACSTVKSSKPSISRIRPLNTFFLPAFSTVNKPSLMAW